jgi:hypothetical protein
MRWSDIPFTPSSRTLRQFAALLLVIFGGLACWYGVWRGRMDLALLFGVPAITLGPLGLVRPQALRPVFVTWMVVAFPIGWLISQLLFAALFFGIFLPIAILFRVLGRDALARRYEPDAATYWIPKPAAVNVRAYFRQF